jgi:hypothetical protein
MRRDEKLRETLLVPPRRLRVRVDLVYPTLNPTDTCWRAKFKISPFRAQRFTVSGTLPVPGTAAGLASFISLYENGFNPR